MKGKKKQQMIKYCCFFWTQEPILKPSVFWPKFGSDEDWIFQLPIEFVNDKNPVAQEEIDYVLCWRKGPVVLFPLKMELYFFTLMHWRRKWQPTPVFLPGESQGRGSLVGGRLWDHTELDTTEQLHFHFILGNKKDLISII